MSKEEEERKYGLVWEDNVEEVEEELKYKTVKLKEEESLGIYKGEECTDNLLIEGDNLESLTYLKNKGKKVEVIYIDPPYNSLHADGSFNYKDRRLNKEDKYKHSSWLSFMEKRLKIARELLTEDGVMFVSIDDRELYNLKLLCDIIFGGNGYMGNIVWLKGNSQRDANNIQKNHENILVYTKNKNNKRGILSETLTVQKEVEEDSHGFYYMTGNLNFSAVRNGTLDSRPNLGYTVYYNPESGEFLGVQDRGRSKVGVTDEEEEVYEDDEDLISEGYVKIRPNKKGEKLGVWRWGIERFNSHKNEIKIKEGKDGKYRIFTKKYVNEEDVKLDEETGKINVIYDTEVPIKNYIEGINSGRGALDLREIFGRNNFSYPKPVSLIKKLIEYTGGKDERLTILDFFSGSGTTGHAVMEYNKEHGTDYNFILCTNNENNICREVTYQRLNKVINGYTTPKGREVEGIPSNLKYYKTELIDKNKNKEEDS